MSKIYLAIGVLVSKNDINIYNFLKDFTEKYEDLLISERVTISQIIEVENNKGLTKSIFLNEAKNNNVDLALIVDKNTIINGNLKIAINKMLSNNNFNGFTIGEKWNPMKGLINMHEYINMIYKTSKLNESLLEDLSLLNEGYEYVMNMALSENGSMFGNCSDISIKSDIIYPTPNDIIKISSFASKYLPNFIKHNYHRLIR